MPQRLAFWLLVAASAAPAAAQPQVALEVAFPTLYFTRPVDLQHDDLRLFVVEQRGVITTFENDKVDPDATTFLDIRSRVSTAGNEEGLLGLALHPDFATNRYFFVYYSARGGPRRSVVARYQTNRSDPPVASADSETIVLTFNQPAGNHNGGQLAFGPDGLLYIAIGDGGGSGDQFGNGQNRNTLHGTIARIDVSTLPFTIPPDNPFVRSTGRPEIYAYGLRNPWRISFDPLTGLLYAADVGQNAVEEIDIITPGGNYGWNYREGTRCFRNCNNAPAVIPPIFEYSHGGSPASVTGGYVYHGPGVPDLRTWYTFGDYVDGRIWGLMYDGTTVVQSALLMDTQHAPLSFGVDHLGEVYMLAGDGRIYWFTSTGGALGFEAFMDDQNYEVGAAIASVTLPPARGGTAPYTYTLSPELPDGLVFDPATRSLNGTPTAGMPATQFTYTATEADGRQGSLDFGMVVSSPVSRHDSTEPVPVFVLHSLYPNPTTDQATLAFDLPESGVVSVSVIDLLGREVATVPGRAYSAARGHSLDVPLHDVGRGVYLVRLQLDKRTEAPSKILVVR